MNIAKFEDVLEKGGIDDDVVMSALGGWVGYLKDCPEEHLRNVYNEILVWLVYGLHINAEVHTVGDTVSMRAKQFFHEQMGEYLKLCADDANLSLLDLSVGMVKADKDVYNRFTTLMKIMVDIKPTLEPVERHLALKYAQRRWNAMTRYFKAHMTAIAVYFDPELESRIDKAGVRIHNDKNDNKIDSLCELEIHDRAEYKLLACYELV